MSIATQSRPASYVEVPLTYTAKTGEKAVLYEFQRESSTHQFESHPMKVHDARPLLDSLSLDTNGFTLVRHHTEVRDFYDPAEVHEVYFPEIERLMRELTGAFRVIVFGEAVRTEGPQARSDRLPARNAHVDFNAPTVRNFVRGLAPAEAEALLKHRFALVNLWRPVKPIEKVPLAVCDARTVAADDLILGEIGVKPGDDAPRMEGFNVAFNHPIAGIISPICRPTRCWSSSCAIPMRAGCNGRRTRLSTTRPALPTRLPARASKCGRSRSTGIDRQPSVQRNES